MFDEVFENKAVGATIITSAIGVALILGCCFVKRRVYKRSEPKPNVGRERLESHAISSSKSAFTPVTPSAPPPENNK